MHDVLHPIAVSGSNDRHGDRCACRLLAAVVGCKPGAITVAYCRSVLMKRWVMECNHGCLGGDTGLDRGSEKWRYVGPIDPVKAILIKNE